MTRIELTAAIAVILLLAAAIGWALHALWARLIRGGAPALAEHSQMADLLLAANAERDAALTRERETEARLTAAHAAERAELSARLAEREAEIAATMESLGDLRREIADWRAAYEAMKRQHDD